MSSVTMSTTSRAGAQAAASPAADPDQGPALRPVRGEPGLLGRDRGQPPRPGRDQVLQRDVPVVGAQVAAHVARDRVVHRVAGLDLGRRLRQQGVLLVAPRLSAIGIHSLVSRPAKVHYNQSRSSHSSG